MASFILDSILPMGRISPPSPTSPKKHMLSGMGVSSKEEKIAAQMAKSSAVSCTLMPPAMFKNTSWLLSRIPSRFSMTARSMVSRLSSYPVALRWAEL